MNTFLPSPDYAVCAKVLDPARLGRQISEVVQLAPTLWVWGHAMHLTGRRMPWGVNFSPVINLWVSKNGTPLLKQLYEYHHAMNFEYQVLHEGVSHGSFANFNWRRLLEGLPWQEDEGRPIWPASVHASHRASLLRKDETFYRRAFQRNGLPIEALGEHYVWESPDVVR